jgi:hypothetical protein
MVLNRLQSDFVDFFTEQVAVSHEKDFFEPYYPYSINLIF